MTTPYMNCKKCGYKGQIGIDIFDGLCQDCGTIENKILEKIKSIKNKGTQTCPEYYVDLMIEIMKYGGLEKEDRKRFLGYFQEK